jgi:hexokinase
LEKQFTLTKQDLDSVVKHLLNEFKLGLKSDNETLRMIPSFVVNRPTGSEIGVFLALDLGGTNFRVCLISLQGNKKIDLSHRKFIVSEELKQGTGEQLFDFFADAVSNFCMDSGLDPKSPIPLGFTFSFPVIQTAINRGSYSN